MPYLTESPLGVSAPPLSTSEKIIQYFINYLPYFAFYLVVILICSSIIRYSLKKVFKKYNIHLAVNIVSVTAASFLIGIYPNNNFLRLLHNYANSPIFERLFYTSSFVLPALLTLAFYELIEKRES